MKFKTVISYEINFIKNQDFIGMIQILCFTNMLSITIVIIFYIYIHKQY